MQSITSMTNIEGRILDTNHREMCTKPWSWKILLTDQRISSSVKMLPTTNGIRVHGPNWTAHHSFNTFINRKDVCPTSFCTKNIKWTISSTLYRIKGIRLLVSFALSTWDHILWLASYTRTKELFVRTTMITLCSSVQYSYIEMQHSRLDQCYRKCISVFNQNLVYETFERLASCWCLCNRNL